MFYIHVVFQILANLIKVISSIQWVCGHLRHGNTNLEPFLITIDQVGRLWKQILCVYVYIYIYP
jgi:hypothetical protein